MAEVQDQPQNVATKFGQLPKNVLQNIFRQGVRKCWRRSAAEEMEDYNAPSSEEDENEYECFLSTNESPRPELETIMNCAVVCRSWADAVLDIGLWEENYLRVSESSLEPWKLRRRWNQFLVNVPVRIPCSVEFILSSIGKIEVSALRGRTQFKVYFPVRKKRRQCIFEMWKMLRLHLWKRCTHLELIAQNEAGNDYIGLGDVIFRPWPRLQSLQLGELQGLSRSSMTALYRLRTTPIETLRQNPPFPALKFMSFRTHPDSHLAREILNIAPNIEHCEMNTFGCGCRADLSQGRSGWDTHRDCLSHRLFLHKDKGFRTYVTSHCMYAFKWPGPKSLTRSTGNMWRMRVLMRHPHLPNYGVLISETRDGTRCELRLSLDDFLAVEDLTQLAIPSVDSN